MTVERKAELKAAVDEAAAKANQSIGAAAVKADVDQAVKAGGDAINAIAAQETDENAGLEARIKVVTFEDGSGQVVTMKIGTDGKLASIPEVPDKTGYIPLGWFDVQTGGSLITVDMVFTDDTKVYAQWKPDTDPGTILVQPQDQHVPVDQQAVFTVTAQGAGLSYQWFINRNNGDGWQLLSDKNRAARAGVVDEAVLNVSPPPTLPNTGDGSNLLIWCALMMLCGMGAMVMRKRSRR